MAEDDANPMQAAPRCAARSKRTGKRCCNSAVKGWSVCRMHGAGGGHAEGPSHPAWKHGMRSRAFVAMRKEINDLARETREIERMINP